MKARELSKGSLWTILAVAFVAMLASVFLVLRAAESVGAQDFGTQVVGGTPVENGKYPFMAALYDPVFGRPSPNTQFCGGTLIDEDSVLTAAHCLFKPSGDLYPTRRVGITVGRTVLTSDQGQVRGVSEFFIHPSYDFDSSDRFDAAVLKLDAPVAGIEPISVVSEEQDQYETPQRVLTVAGWGAVTSPKQTFPDRMEKASVPIVSDSRAEEFYPNEFSRNLMVAAGGEERDTCTGDSGGPIFDRTGSGEFIQVGITSFGKDVCGPRPGVYTEANAPSIRNFISGAAAR